jgi:hypothetical protein
MRSKLGCSHIGTSAEVTANGQRKKNANFSGTRSISSRYLTEEQCEIMQECANMLADLLLSLYKDDDFDGFMCDRGG